MFIYQSISINRWRITEDTVVQKAPIIPKENKDYLLDILDAPPKDLPTVIFPIKCMIHGDQKTRNFTYYPKEGLSGDPLLMTGAKSMTWPYLKPVIENHKLNEGLLSSASPVYGRIVKAWYTEEAGFPEVRAMERITHPDGIRKILSMEFYTNSMGSDVGAVYCSLCRQNQIELGPCEHKRGSIVDGQEILWKMGPWWCQETSYVASPSDSLSGDGPSRVLMPDAGLSTAKILVQSLESVFDIEDNTRDNLKSTKRFYEICGPTKTNTQNERSVQDMPDNILNEEQLEALLVGMNKEEWAKLPDEFKEQLHEFVEKREGGHTHTSENMMGMHNHPSLGMEDMGGDHDHSVDTTGIHRHGDEQPMGGTHSHDDWDWNGKHGHNRSNDTSYYSESTKDPENNKEDKIVTIGEIYALPEDHEDYAKEFIMDEAPLTTSQRKKLKSSTFCGPNRSWPVDSCDRANTARRYLGNPRATKNLSASQKASVRACVNRKAKAMGCDKSKEGYALLLKFPEANIEVPLFDLIASPKNMVEDLKKLESMNLPETTVKEVRNRIITILNDLEEDVSSYDEWTENIETVELEISAENYMQLLPLVEHIDFAAPEDLTIQLEETKAKVAVMEQQIDTLEQDKGELNDSLATCITERDELAAQVDTLTTKVNELNEDLLKTGIQLQEANHKNEATMTACLLWFSQSERARGKTIDQVYEEMLKQHPKVLEFLKAETMEKFKDGPVITGPVEKVEDPTLHKTEDTELGKASTDNEPSTQEEIFEDIVDAYARSIETTDPESDKGDIYPKDLIALSRLVK